jgi:5,10-methylenetetrahydromethanopterin reductase
MTLSIAFQSDKPLAAYGPLAERAEAHGFAVVSVYNDLLYQPAWPALLEMARATRRVRLGPAAVNPFTTHPVNIAGYAALLDEASGGRAYLGLARGAWLDFVGVEAHRPVTALREAFAAVRHLLARNPDFLEGEIFPLAGGDTLRYAVPRADLPLLLGSWGPRTIRACLPYVAEVKLGGTAHPGAAAWFVERIRRWTRELPGAAEPAGVVVGSVTVVDTDRRAARDLARREVALYLPEVARLDPALDLDPALLERLERAAAERDYQRVAANISDDLLDSFAFSGTPDEVAAQAAAVLEAGASRVEFGTPHGLSPASGLKWLGGRVLPALGGR